MSMWNFSASLNHLFAELDAASNEAIEIILSSFDISNTGLK